MTAAVALLGVIAVAAYVTGVLFFFAAWATGNVVFDPFNDIGQVATVLIGVLVIVYGGLATYAARTLWAGRPVGRVMGLIVGLVLVLASVTALLVGDPGDNAPLLAIAAGLGVVTLIPLVLPQGESISRPEAATGSEGVSA